MNRVLTGLAGKVYKRSIADKPTDTVFLGESQNNSFSFVDGYRIGIYAPTPVPPRHSGGMNFVFVDGHAQWYGIADYSRTVAENNSTIGSLVEWAHDPPYNIYWWPCRTCKKL